MSDGDALREELAAAALRYARYMESAKAERRAMKRQQQKDQAAYRQPVGTKVTTTREVRLPDGRLALQVAVSLVVGKAKARVSILDARGEQAVVDDHPERFALKLSDLTDEETEPAEVLCRLAVWHVKRGGAIPDKNLHRVIGPLPNAIAEELADALAMQLTIAVAKLAARIEKEQEVAVLEHVEAARTELDRVARLMTDSPQPAKNRGTKSFKPVPETHGSLL